MCVRDYLYREGRDKETETGIARSRRGSVVLVLSCLSLFDS